jgi:hypothetical protein
VKGERFFYLGQSQMKVSPRVGRDRLGKCEMSAQGALVGIMPAGGQLSLARTFPMAVAHREAMLMQMDRVQDAGVCRRHVQHNCNCRDAVKSLHCLFPRLERGAKSMFSHMAGDDYRRVLVPRQGNSHTRQSLRFLSEVSLELGDPSAAAVAGLAGHVQHGRRLCLRRNWGNVRHRKPDAPAVEATSLFP